MIEIEDIDLSWYAVRPNERTEIVGIGHFDDRRSGWCEATRIQACRDRFVVDRVAWADGEARPTSVVTREGTDDPAFGPVDTAVAAAVDGPILSAAAYRASELVMIEPSLRDGRPGITDEPVVWVVRVLQDQRAVTYLVVDGTDRVHRVEPDGQAVQVGGSPRQDPKRTWPPAGVIDVPLPNVTVGTISNAGVVDRTGLLQEARTARENDPRGPPKDLLVGEMSIIQSAPDTIIAYWDGSLCDDRFVLTVYGQRAGLPPDGLELRGEHADRCRLALVHRGIVLRFSEPVAAGAVHSWNRVGTPFEAFPPVGATVVALPNDGGGFVTPAVRAALVDLSGRITAIRLPRPDERIPIEDLGSGGALVADPAFPGRYQLAWVGGPCAPDVTIEINLTLTRVVVTNTVPPEPPDCDTIAQQYRLVLDINGPLDPPAVEVRQADMSTGAS
jgi:hypothetical protein